VCLYVKHLAVACDWVMEKRTERVFLFIGLKYRRKVRGRPAIGQHFQAITVNAVGLENEPTIVRNSKLWTCELMEFTEQGLSLVKI
jgi:hypothetical protein